MEFSEEKNAISNKFTLELSIKLLLKQDISYISFQFSGTYSCREVKYCTFIIKTNIRLLNAYDTAQTVQWIFL